MTSDRDNLRDELSGWSIGDGYYSIQVGSDDAGEMADAVIASGWLTSVRREAAAEGARASLEGAAQMEFTMGHLSEGQRLQAVAKLYDTPPPKRMTPV